MFSCESNLILPASLRYNMDTSWFQIMAGPEDPTWITPTCPVFVEQMFNLGKVWLNI